MLSGGKAHKFLSSQRIPFLSAPWPAFNAYSKFSGSEATPDVFPPVRLILKVFFPVIGKEKKKEKFVPKKSVKGKSFIVRLLKDVFCCYEYIAS